MSFVSRKSINGYWVITSPYILSTVHKIQDYQYSACVIRFVIEISAGVPQRIFMIEETTSSAIAIKWNLRPPTKRRDAFRNYNSKNNFHWTVTPGFKLDSHSWNTLWFIHILSRPRTPGDQQVKLTGPCYIC